MPRRRRPGATGLRGEGRAVCRREVLYRGGALVERRHERILRRRRRHEAAHLIDRQVENESRRDQIPGGALARLDDSLGHARPDLAETRDVVRHVLPPLN